MRLFVPLLAGLGFSAADAGTGELVAVMGGAVHLRPALPLAEAPLW